MCKGSFAAKKAIKQQQLFRINLLSTVILPGTFMSAAIWLTQLWHNFFSLPTKGNVLLSLRVHIYQWLTWIQTSSLYLIRFILHILIAFLILFMYVSSPGSFVCLCYPVYSCFIFSPTYDYFKVSYQRTFIIAIRVDFNPRKDSSLFH